MILWLKNAISTGACSENGVFCAALRGYHGVLRCVPEVERAQDVRRGECRLGESEVCAELKICAGLKRLCKIGLSDPYSDEVG